MKNWPFLLLIFSTQIYASTIYEISKTTYRGLKKNVEKFEILNRYFVVSNSSPQDLSFNIQNKYPNDDIYLLSLPNSFNKQWGLQNLGQNEPITPSQMSVVSSVKGVDIKAKQAWSLTKGSKDIVIALIDTGIDFKHPELATNIWINEAEKNGLPGIDDDKNGFIDDISGYDFTGKTDSHPQDENGHGTHCAGIIGASHSSGIIAGVMDKVSIMPLRTLDKRGAGKTSQAIQAFSYAIKNGANIISNSWGSKGENELLKELIAEAYKKNIVVIAAAGNSRYNDNDLNPTYPANYEHVISVSAVNARGRHSAYSTFGETTVHIGAPGTNILSSYILRKKEIYRVMSGTSMAAPFISGAVGLFMSLHGTQVSPDLIKKHLIETAMPLKHLERMNQAQGMLNMYDFLSKY